jgi:hypothetical protein
VAEEEAASPTDIDAAAHGDCAPGEGGSGEASIVVKGSYGTKVGWHSAAPVFSFFFVSSLISISWDVSRHFLGKRTFYCRS